MVAETINGTQQALNVPQLAPGQRYELTYPIPTDHRGVYHLGPVTIGQSDPLRLVWSGSRDDRRDTLHVHPRIHRVAPMPSGLSRDMDGQDATSAPQGGVAFHSVREYVSGDSWRLIHWATSARLGTLMVRHNIVPNESHLVVVLDTSTAPYSDRTFEEAVSTAASLCVAAARAGYRLDLRTTAHVRARLAGGRAGTDQLPSLLDACAEVRRGADAGLVPLCQTLPADSGAALTVVTGRVGADALGAVAVLSSRFLVTSLIQLADDLVVPTSLHGVRSVVVGSGGEFAKAWNRLIRT